MKLLLVAREPDLALLSYWLGRHGYHVVAVGDGRKTVRRCRAERPDLVILDRDALHLDGLEMCHTLASEFSVMIIYIGARDQVHEEVCALDLGADVYLRKPIRANQVLARVRSLERRSPGWRVSNGGGASA